MLKSNDKFLCQDALIFLLGEFQNLKLGINQVDRVIEVGIDMGPRLYESLYFSNRVNYDGESRKLKIYDILEYCKRVLW